MTQNHQTFKILALTALALSLDAASPAFAESVGHYIDDATITAKVKEAIFADSQLKVLQVKVDTLHGVVALSGTVDTKDQENEAVKVATQINGVTLVTDNLSVQPTSAEAEQE